MRGPGWKELASAGDGVTVVPPSFALQKKVGGPAARLLTPDRVRRAETAVARLVPPLREVVRRQLERLQDLSRGPMDGRRDPIFAEAHELRGLAGTAGWQRLGQMANLLCRYLEDTPATFRPDAALLGTITVVAGLAASDTADTDPVIGTLVADAARAVLVQRRREGRS